MESIFQQENIYEFWIGTNFGSLHVVYPTAIHIPNIQRSPYSEVLQTRLSEFFRKKNNSNLQKHNNPFQPNPTHPNPPIHPSITQQPPVRFRNCRSFKVPLGLISSTKAKSTVTFHVFCRPFSRTVDGRRSSPVPGKVGREKTGWEGFFFRLFFRCQPGEKLQRRKPLEV